MPRSPDAPAADGDRPFLGATLRLRAKARLADVARANVVVEGLARAEHWPESSAYQVTLAIEELCTAIIEGPGAEASGVAEIFLEVRSEEGAVTLEVAHEGPPFNALFDGVRMDLNAPVEERMEAGLGANLVISMMDDWDYVREAQRNRVTLVKRTQ